MSLNKKLAIIFTVLVVLPILFSFYVDYLDESSNVIDLSRSSRYTLSFIFLGIIIFSNLLIMFLNYKSIRPRSFWYSIPITVIVVFSLIFYFSYSLSNFG